MLSSLFRKTKDLLVSQFHKKLVLIVIIRQRSSFQTGYLKNKVDKMSLDPKKGFHKLAKKVIKKSVFIEILWYAKLKRRMKQNTDIAR